MKKKKETDSVRSRKLEKAQGININNQYHGKEAGVFEKMMINTFLGDKPIKHSYYELVDKDGRIVQIVDTKEEFIVQSAAYRMGLDYRLIEFNVTYEDLDKEQEVGENKES